MIDRNKNVFLHLSLIPNIGPASIMRIIKGIFWDQYPDLLQAGLMEFIEVQENLDFEQLYTFNTHDFIKKCGLNNTSAQDVVNGLANKALLDAELTLIKKHKVDVISVFDVHYPDILKQIYSPPIILYIQGQSLHNLAKRLSIVGSRKADNYAQKVVTSIVPELVVRDWHIVSGGAEGVDSMAHEATLAAGGKTVVVMGSGFLHPYPANNEKMFQTIVTCGGTLVSPFSLQTRPDRGTFPARNRIIAGLSQGCVVVRAAEKSGALITAQFALDQGRLIFAVPGSIYDELSVGCHELIKQGAKLVNTAGDILEDFGETVSTGANFNPAVAHKTTEQISHFEPATKITEDPLLVFMNSACSLDDLSIKTELSFDKLQQKLFELQLEGKVRQNFAGLWERVL